MKSELGKKIRKFRVSKGVSGAQLARALSISQSNISRIENGILLPDRLLIDRIAKFLELEPNERSSLLCFADFFLMDYDKWSLSDDDNFRRSQDTVAKLEQSASNIREFDITGISGLLQTEEYIREIFLNAPLGSIEEKERGINARLKRQREFFRSPKRFQLVFAEHALLTRLTSGNGHREQLNHIASFLKSESVTIRMIPASTRLKRLPAGSFTIYDDRFVSVGLQTRSVYLWSEIDVRYYIELYSYLENVSIGGADFGSWLCQAIENIAN